MLPLRNNVLCYLSCVVFLLLSCSDKPTVDTPHDEDPYTDLRQLSAQTPRANEEAELMAIWLSNEIVAPDSLYEELSGKVGTLRAGLTATVPELGQIEFILPVPESKLIVDLADSAAQEFRAGSYDAWDTLNALLGVTSIDTNSHFDYFRMVVLAFSGRYNPHKVETWYLELPGVGYASTSGRAGDWSVLLPWYVDGELVFFLREGSGDCPSGCLHSEVWYFRPAGESYSLSDTWSSCAELPCDPAPGWYAEWQAAKHRYFYWFDYQ